MRTHTSTCVCVPCARAWRSRAAPPDSPGACPPASAPPWGGGAVSAWVAGRLLTALLSTLTPSRQSSIVCSARSWFRLLPADCSCRGPSLLLEGRREGRPTNCRVSVLHLNVHTLLLLFVLSTVESPYLAPGSALQASMKCKVFI